MIIAAERKKGNDDDEQYYSQSVHNKKHIISQLNTGNYKKVAHLDIGQVIDGFAYFIDSHTLTIQPTKASNQNGRGMLTYQQNGSENSITADAVLISVK